MQRLSEWSALLEGGLSPIVSDIEAVLGAEARPSGSGSTPDPAVTLKLLEAINQVRAARCNERDEKH